MKRGKIVQNLLRIHQSVLVIKAGNCTYQRRDVSDSYRKQLSVRNVRLTVSSKSQAPSVPGQVEERQLVGVDVL